MQEFYIKRGSVLPILRMDLINDGRHDFNKFFDLIQNSDITFSMTNKDNGILKISNSPCYIKLRETDGCIEKYVICYDWKTRDTSCAGTFEGEFTLDFGKVKSDDVTFPSGTLKMPIREKLEIIIEE